MNKLLLCEDQRTPHVLDAFIARRCVDRKNIKYVKCAQVGNSSERGTERTLLLED